MSTLTALFSKARAETLRLLFSQPGREIYLRDLARLAGVTPAAEHKELVFLCKLGLVRSRRDGNRLYFQADKAHPVYSELRGLVVKTTGVAAELQQVLSKVPGVDLAFIFGSVAAGTDHAESDVDILVIGSAGLRKITPALRGVPSRLEHEINPVCMTPDEWRQKHLRKDVFVNRLLSEPRLWLKGGDDELEKLG